MNLQGMNYQGMKLAGIGHDVQSAEGEQPQVISRDVCVIGGGAAGTYAAIRLRQLGRSVVLVEKEDLLGGHTNTYYDPSGTPIDYGVWVYSNNTEMLDFFAHFNIPLTGLNFAEMSARDQRVDLRTGQRVPPPGGNIVDAMTRYVGILLQHPYLADGWELPNPVPEDLLISFQGFLEKYDLGAVAELLTLYVQGLGEILQYPAVYVMKYFSVQVALGVQGGFSTSARRANGELYEAARKELGEDALLSSTILRMDRSDSDTHSILVRSASGKKRIEADKLIIAIPPLLKLMENFDLDDHEESIFGQFKASHYYTTVFNISGLPNGTEIVNRGADTPYNVPPLPGAYVFTPSAVENLFTGFIGSGNQSLTEEEVGDTLSDNVLSLRNAGYDVDEPEIVAFSDHSPFNLFVSSEQIAAGFYRDLYALQGHRKTFYTGAAWHAHSSTALWEFTERLLHERILADDSPGQS
ncbi:hypothetical protein BJX99DRAFT_251219 [Aspergillus californicus]